MSKPSYSAMPDKRLPDDGNGDDNSYNAGWNACREAVLAEFIRDAERYRYLRDSIAKTSDHLGVQRADSSVRYRGAELDAVIDEELGLEPQP